MNHRHVMESVNTDRVWRGVNEKIIIDNESKAANARVARQIYGESGGSPSASPSASSSFSTSNENIRTLFSSLIPLETV